MNLKFMYYNFFDKFLLFNEILLFKIQLILYFSGSINEEIFKIIRLKLGFYRQNFSYMLRILIPYNNFNINQIYFLSYLIFKYDKFYFHLTTRNNIQIDWIKIFYFNDFFYLLNKFNIISIQSSGNCVRNITSDFFNFKFFSEIIKQWFYLNNEFLFLPRKFKITLTKNSFLRINDLGINYKINFNLNLNFFFYLGGGLGRNPIIGLNFLNKINWYKIILYIEKILRFYNIYGFRNNIYKSRLKILLKFLFVDKFNIYLINEIKIFNNKFLYLNEKEINLIIKKFFLKLIKIKFNNYNNKIFYNKFFLSWLKYNFLKNFIIINLKIFNKSSGNLNFLQIKFIKYLSYKFKFDFLRLSIKQNILINLKNIYKFYLNFKKFFFIFNNNLINDIVNCPGKDYCSLASSKSILINKIIQNKFFNLNLLFNFKFINFNISGCINSCSHHHLSNFGFIGFNKKLDEYYQVYLGGYYNNYNDLIFSKPLNISFNLFSFLNKIFSLLKIFINKNFYKVNFKYFLNQKGYQKIKNLFLN